jgi:hypothetical protein
VNREFHPWGTTLPLGVKFTPRGEVKNGPLVTLVVCKIRPWSISELVAQDEKLKKSFSERFECHNLPFQLVSGFSPVTLSVARSRDRCSDFLNVFAKKLAKKLRVFDSKHC